MGQDTFARRLGSARGRRRTRFSFRPRAYARRRGADARVHEGSIRSRAPAWSGSDQGRVQLLNLAASSHAAVERTLLGPGHPDRVLASRNSSACSSTRQSKRASVPESSKDSVPRPGPVRLRSSRYSTRLYERPTPPDLHPDTLDHDPTPLGNQIGNRGILAKL